MADNGQSGHRKRLRKRFLSGETEAHSDEMLLELLLTFAIARKDTRPLAQELINIFGSFTQVLSASSSALNKVNGLGESSVTLLKVVSFIQSGIESPEKTGAPAKKAGAIQQKLFNDTAEKQTAKQLSEDFDIAENGNRKEPKIPLHQPAQHNEITNFDGPAAAEPPLPHQSSSFNKKTSLKKPDHRKLQVSNGYLLEFDQLARVLHFLLENRHAKKINRKVLQENTGLADRQVESLVSMGSAMGLIKPGVQILTPTGLLIAEHDIFLENKGALEWCHYIGAGSYRNLVWFELFNCPLHATSPMTQEEWSDRIRNDLAGQYSKRTISKGVHEEVRFVIDAYMKRNFSKLEIVNQLANQQLYRRRYTGFAPLVLAAMIYDFGTTNQTHLFQLAEMATMPGSPAVVFGLDEISFRQQMEGLHDHGWLRYETTHNLDQLRLKPGFCALEFLTAYFENREPHSNDELGMKNDA